MTEQIVKELNVYLASLAVNYVKLHNLHWNVVGTQFKAVHEYLEVLYDGFADSLDEVAELLKKNEKPVKATIKDYVELSLIKEIESKDYTVCESLNIVLEDMVSLKNKAEEIRKAADELDLYDVVSTLEGDLENYNKTIWFIKSMVKNGCSL